MPLPISRGRISHTLRSEAGWLLRSLFGKLSDDSVIRQAEAKFAAHIGRSECIVFPFARTAIWATMQELNLPRGSRVIMPPITIKPILDVVVHLGYEPVFVDIDPTTACFDEQELAEVVKSRPAVAILTYLFGLVPNVERITRMLQENGVYIIEDFSQCLNGEFGGRRIGTFGQVAIYSASSVKTFDTFGGGYALTDDPAMIAGLRRRQAELAPSRRADLVRSVVRNFVRNLASSRVMFSVVTFPLLRLATKFSKKAVGRFTGARSTQPLGELPREWFRRYTSVQARVALAELPRVQARDERRVAAVERMVTMSGVSDRPFGAPGQRHVYWQFIVYVADFASARERLAQHGVDCATTSLVLLTDLPKYPGQRRTPAADRLFHFGVYLPCYHQLRHAEVDRIGNALRELAATP
ncbi:MAG: DegT/DnrJ/EryC1/StrS family aminotransferase [Ilumatobacteraceae bacterium]